MSTGNYNNDDWQPPNDKKGQSTTHDPLNDDPALSNISLTTENDGNMSRLQQHPIPPYTGDTTVVSNNPFDDKLPDPIDNNKNKKSDNGAEVTAETLSDDEDTYTSTHKTPVLSQHARFPDATNSHGNDSVQDDTGMRRLRWGTQRFGNGKPKVGRAKTLKWAKQNFQKNIANPFVEEFLGHDDSDLTGESKNRSNETRNIYYNMELPPEMLNDEGKPKIDYPRNKIRTTKYTPITFIPKNLSFQFKNIANVYFLVMNILGAFPIFGVTNPGLASVPLIVIVCITAIKDAIEDSRRTILDLEVNNTPTHILNGIENYNVSEDNVSLWRKFKKANSRLLFSAFRYCKSHLSKSGRAKLLRERHKQELHALNDNFNIPRNSFDSMASFRDSAQYDEDDDQYQQNYAQRDQNIIDPHMPMRTDCKFAKNYWKNVKVGDIIRIHMNDEIPADIVLLSTSDPDGGCYVETKNLDGETNLKIRQALKCSSRIRNSRDITRTSFWIESEGPHPNLYSYQGNLKWMERDQYGAADPLTKNEPISINNTLLRGCTLRNTKWAMGIVIFTGDDTKIMLNAGATPTKKSRISRELNWSVILNFFLLFILCFVSGIVNGVYYRRKNDSRTYFEFGTVVKTPAANGVVSFFVAVILYQSLVPISLYISVEIIKTAQAAFIYGDVLMYNEKLDYPCTPKSWNISDDVGQVEYIFSDKTGTLTQNVMEFKKCTINGVSYGRAYTEALAGLRKRQGIDVEREGMVERKAIAEDKQSMLETLETKLGKNSQFFAEDVTLISKKFVEDLLGASGDYQKNCNEHFMLTLALCHTVLTEPSKENPAKLELKAQSPDEAALVGTARDMGFSFLNRTKHGVIVEVLGVQKEFEILNVLEFNSTRKRMSCIVKLPPRELGGDPRALLICKGADSVIYSRLSKTANDETLLEKTALHLEQFATEGLRTLCLAQRELPWNQYLEWNKKHDLAAASLKNREEEMEKVADEVEQDLILLGGTAIEDRLQDGVPESIALLSEAGVKLWVLTGDKVETAINIGFSCNLLGNNMELLVVKCSGDDVDETQNPSVLVNDLIEKYLSEKFGMRGSEEELERAKKEHSVPTGEFGVIIDGQALKLALIGPDISRKFLLLCKNCKAVLCCRVSPAQKAAVVKLVKNSLDVMTLAIGDGSNDVAMIQSADVGVGIAGEEGRQAVMSSDYAIGQFRYLTRLVLVHGRWSYKRLSEMIPCFFYKNVIFTLALFWYGIYDNFDGSYLFEYTYLTFYNLAFTSLPIIFLGILDQDVSDVVSVLVPQLFRCGILRSEWTISKFWGYMLDGVYQSIICFFFPYLLYYRTGFVSGNGLDLQQRYWVGIAVTAISVISCNSYIFLHQYRWDWFTFFWVCISILFFIGWTGIWTSFVKSGEFYKSGKHFFGSPVFWAVLFVGVLFCLLPRMTYDVFQKMFWPKDIDIIRECWKRGEFDQYPVGYDPTDPNRHHISSYSMKQIADIESEHGNFDHDFSEHIDATSISNIANPFEPAIPEDGKERKHTMSAAGDEVEEIPLDFVGNYHNGNESNDKQYTTMTRDYHNPRKSLGNANRTSLDITRENMMRNNELDQRMSIERARTSLELPGITRADDLLSKK
ncbi:aminophospholipid-translocating P4-type ATPase DNF1 SCDLUD_001667 [Saccharomycodes ludwigii]|uniref:aminophospholipid-translocating P4-type ATPase DNF1 n=1 Tax=Saccharomycodes ludwigii TaxID=36035 RepID=UPI001E89A389|nr:hypothetical protein SCDLUD_001667 [Saccharomycodes ludwigii]KAH3901883.1 hypothetical protein SCDLUD_001667 [Saccharomycodes ludwigii]